MLHLMLFSKIEYCMTIAFKFLYDNSYGGNDYVSFDAIQRADMYSFRLCILFCFVSCYFVLFFMQNNASPRLQIL